MTKTKRQALSITLNELISLFIDLRIQQKEFMEQFQLKNKPNFNEKFQINIINKTPECSDTWEIEREIDESLDNKEIPKENNCLNCKHSFRDKEDTLNCKMNHTTFVSKGRRCFEDNLQETVKPKEKSK